MGARARPGTGRNQGAVRRHNLGTVLGHVHHSGEVSRAELTARMGLNRSTIAGLVGELVDARIVEQVAPRADPDHVTVGRPSLDVRPIAGRVCTVAVEVHIGGLTAALVGLGGQVLRRLPRRDAAGREPSQVAAAVAEVVRDLVGSADPDAALVGVGVALPGVVSDADGLVRFAPNLGWADVPFAAHLVGQLGRSVPVHLGNDADLGALAEHTRGAGAAYDDLVFLSADVGIGGGVVTGGQALSGAGGYAGELGHMAYDRSGQQCRCGNRGCWETYVGSPAIAQALGVSEDPAELEARMTTLVARAHESTDVPPEFATLGHHLGTGLGSIVNLLNPQAVILGGLLRHVYPLIRRETDAALARTALVAPHAQVTVVLPGLGGDSILLGAAELAFDDLLRDPVDVVARAEGVTAGLVTSAS